MALNSARGKLERAKSLVDLLRAQLNDAGGGDLHNLPLVREYEPDLKSVVYRVGDSYNFQPHWPFLASEAVHHMRSALDNAWWDCAIVFLKREPTEDEAPRISFPIRRPGNDWNAESYRRWVGPSVEGIAKRYQPPKTWDYVTFDALGSLNRLWNLDKHRTLPLLLQPVRTFSSTPLQSAEYVDCVLEERAGDDGKTGVARYSIPGPINPRPGEKVAEIYVRKTGANPDVDANVEVAVAILTDQNWDLIESLDEFHATVTKILSDIQSQL